MRKDIGIYGCINEKILSNASKVAGLHIPMVIRIPAIHGVNTDDKNIMETLKFIRHELNGAKLEFLPYHTLGEESIRIGNEGFLEGICKTKG